MMKQCWAIGVLWALLALPFSAQGTLQKVTVIDKIEILETGHIQVRRATYITEDGKRISSPTYHRVAYDPGADVSQEDARVKAHAAVAWTPEVIAAHKARQAAQR